MTITQHADTGLVNVQAFIANSDLLTEEGGYYLDWGSSTQEGGICPSENDTLNNSMNQLPRFWFDNLLESGSQLFRAELYEDECTSFVLAIYTRRNDQTILVQSEYRTLTPTVVNYPSYIIDSWGAFKVPNTTSKYTMFATYNFSIDEYEANLRRTVGDPLCTAPLIIPESDNAGFQGMANRILVNGQETQSFGVLANVVLLFIVTNDADVILDYDMFCQDYNI